jgi:hypothetical protein
MNGVPADNSAVGLGWGGAIDTDLQFSEFFTSDHTVAVLFLAQYPYAYVGPILAENGTGRYLIGQGDYVWNGSPPRTAGPPGVVRGRRQRARHVHGAQPGPQPLATLGSRTDRERSVRCTSTEWFSGLP